MLESYLRPKFDAGIVLPVARRLSLSANSLTLFGFIFGIAIFPALLLGSELYALLFLALTGYCDTLDGMVARLHDSATDIGGFLDVMSDRIVEVAIIAGLFTVHPKAGVIIFFMISSILLCVTSFLLVGIYTSNQTEKSFYYSAGLIERAEAFIFFALMMIFPIHFNAIALVFILLVLVTTVVRIYEFYRHQV